MKTEPSHQSQKSLLRKNVRRARTGIDERQRKTLDGAINRHLLDHVAQSGYGVIAAFSAFDGEPDLIPALDQLEEQGIKLALPVVEDEPGRPVIGFRQWWRGCDLAANRYGIPEPANTPEIHVAEIDLVLIPLVAWDDSGGRLGMGASYYDRLFQPFAQRSRPARVGVAYAVQKVERVPMEPWDIRMHAVLCESGWFNCRREEE